MKVLVTGGAGFIGRRLVAALRAQDLYVPTDWRPREGREGENTPPSTDMSAPSRVLSVVIPVYNEARNLTTVVERVLSNPWVYDILIVDDGSTDGSTDVVRTIERERGTAWMPPFVRCLYQPENRGKGAALRAAFERAEGELIVPQDADLELDPREYERLLAPLLRRQADVVFGARFLRAGEGRIGIHAIGNRFLTWLTNLFLRCHLHDMETCYKMFRRDLLRRIRLTANRFEIEPELTAAFVRCGARVREVSIGYRPRTYEEGKKIGFKDAISTLFHLLWYAYAR